MARLRHRWASREVLPPTALRATYVFVAGSSRLRIKLMVCSTRLNCRSPLRQIRCRSAGPRGCLTIPVVARRAASRRQVRALGVPGVGPRTGPTWVCARCGESACMVSRGRRELSDRPWPPGPGPAPGRSPCARGTRAVRRRRRLRRAGSGAALRVMCSRVHSCGSSARTRAGWAAGSRPTLRNYRRSLHSGCCRTPRMRMSRFTSSMACSRPRQVMWSQQSVAVRRP